MSSNFYQVCFVDEILAGTFPTHGSKSVRVLGKLKSYNPVTSVGRLSDPECKTLLTLSVNLRFIEDVSFLKDSLYQITGEIREVGGEKVLNSTTARNIDSTDFQMFKEAIHMRRKFLNKE